MSSAGNIGEILDDTRLINLLAAIEHERWSSWHKHAAKTLRDARPLSDVHEAILSRWDLQAATPYSALSEREKEADRKEVRNTLRGIEQFVDTVS